MKKYNIHNYIRYKEDVKRSMPIDKPTPHTQETNL